MHKMRGFVIVLDSFGVGAAPDAAKFGDEGASTIKTIYKSKYFSAENMKKMGLLAIDGIDLDSKDNHTAHLQECASFRQARTQQ